MSSMCKVRLLGTSRFVAVVAPLVLAATLVACGAGGGGAGGGGGGGGTAPTFLTQPQGQAVATGTSAIFTASAAGNPAPTLQWQRNGTAIPGATGTSYSSGPTTAADHGAVFRVVATNSAGSAASADALLEVLDPPVITADPASVTADEPDAATFGVTATGSPPLTYRWQFNGADLQGATSASIEFSPTAPSEDGAVLKAIVSNRVGSATSAQAILTVRTVPVILVPPGDQSVDEGQSATFAVTAGGTKPLSYQWRRNGVPIPGATSASYSTPAATAAESGDVFTVVVSNARGTVTSPGAALAVVPAGAPTIPPAGQPAGVTVTLGQTATFTVTANGAPPLSYQWQRNGVVIPGATAASFTTAPTVAGDDGAIFTVVVSNARGTVTSAGATLTVGTPPTVTQQPQNLSVTAGQAATFSVVAAGTAPLTYQWRRNGVAIPGATAPSFTTAPTVSGDSGAVFTVVVTNAFGTATSAAATLTVTPPGIPPTITQQPQNLSVTAGQDATFTVVATGTAPLSFRWQRDGLDVPGATASSFTLRATQLTDGGAHLSVVVSNASGTVTSATALLSVEVNLPPAPTAPPITTFEVTPATSQVTPNDPNVFQALTYAIATPPAHGTASVSAAGLVTYAPAPGFTGADSLVVTVADDGVPSLSGSVTIHVQVNPSIVLTVTANTDPAPALGLVTYEMKVANVGGSAFATVVLSNVTPNNAAIALSSSGSPACTNNAVACQPGGMVTWPAFSLAPGEIRTFTALAQIATGTPTATVIHDVATVTFNGATVTRAADIVVSNDPGLRLVTAADRDPVAPGESLTYTVVVGNVAAQGLPTNGLGTVSATLPPGTTFVSATQGGTAASGTVTWSLGALNPGDSRRFQFTVGVAGATAVGTVLQTTAAVGDGTSSLVRAQAATDVRAALPLQLTVSVSGEPAGALDLLTYEYKVANSGGTTVSNLVLSELGLEGLATNLSSSGAPACNNNAIACQPGGILTWPTFSLAPGQVATFIALKQVANAATSGFLLRSIASVSTPTGRLAKTTPVVVSNAAGLLLDVSPDRNPVAPGDTVTYTLVLGNVAAQALPANAAGVVTATLPPGTTFVSATQGGTAASGAVTWTLGALNPGDSRRFQFTVSVPGATPVGTALQSSAAVDDGTFSLVRAQAATDVRAAIPLRLTISIGGDPAGALGLVTYEYKIANSGNTTVANLVLSELALEGSATNLSSSGAPACNNNAVACQPGGILTWPTFSLAPGQIATFTALKQVVNAAPPGLLVRNIASVATPAGRLAQATALVVSNAPGLLLDVSPDRNPVAPGDTVTYTLVLGNVAAQALPANAAGVVTATLPPGTTFVSATQGGTAASGAVTWTLGALNPGDARRFQFTVTVPGATPVGTVLQSAAEVGDGTSSLVRAQAATDVRAAIPLRLTVSVSSDPSAALDLVTYEYKIANTGGTTVANLVLSELALAGAATNLASSGSPACNDNAVACQAGGVLTWPTFSLASGQTATFTAVKQVVNGAPSGFLVRSVASVSTPAGRLAQTTALIVNDAPGLRLGVTFDRDPVAPGGTVTYAIALGNTAAQGLPASAAGVLSATLPPGTTLVSASPGGAQVGGSVAWSFGSLAASASARFDYTVAVPAATPPGSALPVTAEIDDGNVTVVRAQAANGVQATTPVTLALTASADPVAPLASTTFTASITNTTVATVGNVVLSVRTLDHGQVLLASSTAGITCNNNVVACQPSGIVAWPAFSLVAGETRTFTWVTQVLAGSPHGALVRTRVGISSGVGITSGARDVIVN